jgi:hypothetical protein
LKFFGGDRRMADRQQSTLTGHASPSPRPAIALCDHVAFAARNSDAASTRPNATANWSKSSTCWPRQNAVRFGVAPAASRSERTSGPLNPNKAALRGENPSTSSSTSAPPRISATRCSNAADRCTRRKAEEWFQRLLRSHPAMRLPVNFATSPLSMASHKATSFVECQVSEEAIVARLLSP